MHYTQGHLSYFSVKSHFAVPLDKNKASKITGFDQEQAHNNELIQVTNRRYR